MENYIIEELTKKVDKHETKIEKLEEKLTEIKEVLAKTEITLENSNETIMEVKKACGLITELNSSLTVLSRTVENLSLRISKMENDNNVSVLGVSKDIVMKIILGVAVALIGLVIGKNIM